MRYIVYPMTKHSATMILYIIGMGDAYLIEFFEVYWGSCVLFEVLN